MSDETIAKPKDLLRALQLHEEALHKFIANLRDTELFMFGSINPQNKTDPDIGKAAGPSFLQEFDFKFRESSRLLSCISGELSYMMETLGVPQAVPSAPENKVPAPPKKGSLRDQLEKSLAQADLAVTSYIYEDKDFPDA